MTIRNPGLVGAASSVFAASGEFRWGATDLAWKDPSIALALVRVYRSGSAYVGALGAGWQHQYEQRILVAPGTAEYRDGRLNSIIFTSVQGAWTPPAGVYLRLDYDAPNDEYVVEQRGRVFLRFENAGPGDYRLRAISPPSGRGIEIAYDVSGRIEMVTDWRGRELSFAYGAGNLLSGVSDGTGRAVQFEYDGGVLARVRGPATAAFPLGIVTLYEYVGGKLAVIRDGLEGYGQELWTAAPERSAAYPWCLVQTRPPERPYAGQEYAACPRVRNRPPQCQQPRSSVTS